jgi:hypothetical protein
LISHQYPDFDNNQTTITAIIEEQDPIITNKETNQQNDEISMKRDEDARLIIQLKSNRCPTNKNVFAEIQSLNSADSSEDFANHSDDDNKITISSIEDIPTISSQNYQKIIVPPKKEKEKEKEKEQQQPQPQQLQSAENVNKKHGNNKQFSSFEFIGPSRAIQKKLQQSKGSLIEQQTTFGPKLNNFNDLEKLKEFRKKSGPAPKLFLPTDEDKNEAEQEIIAEKQQQQQQIENCKQTTNQQQLQQQQQQLLQQQQIAENEQQQQQQQIVKKQQQQIDHCKQTTTTNADQFIYQEADKNDIVVVSNNNVNNTDETIQEIAKDLPPKFDAELKSRSRSRSDSRSSDSYNSSCSSRSRSRTPSRSRKRTRSHSRTPQRTPPPRTPRTPDIPRRRGSPSFLEKRRITR